MKFSKEIVVSMDAKKLRYVAESEVNTSVYIGYNRELDDVVKEGEKTGIVYDVNKLFDGLSVLFQKYSDICVEKTDKSFVLSGEPKTYSRDVACTPYTKFQYHYDVPIIQIAGEYEVDAYCQQTELIACLTDTAIFHFLLLIQNDDDLKKCYLEFLDFIQPYKDMLTNQKNEFAAFLLDTIMEHVRELPRGKVKAMPITLNLPLLVYQLKAELLAYDFEGTEYDVYERGLTLYLRSTDQKFSVGLEPTTMNGLLLGMPTRIKFDFHILDTEQVISMLKTLILKLHVKENVYCQMFAQKALDSLYDLIFWDESDSEKDYKKIFGE